jgi:hypothetical protein
VDTFLGEGTLLAAIVLWLVDNCVKVNVEGESRKEDQCHCMRISWRYFMNKWIEDSVQ